MEPRTSPPFRADHVGSLLRPESVRRARADHEAGRIDAAELRAVEDGAIRDAIALQHDVGLRSAPPTASSGARRGTWTSSISSAA